MVQTGQNTGTGFGVYGRMVVRVVLCGLAVFGVLSLLAQPISGVWRGRVQKGRPPFATNFKVEVKIIRYGDSLTGTSYYYGGPQHYYRYAIRGYLDAQDGSLHWWDDTLLESRAPRTSLLPVNSQPLAMQADFNCPGAGIMKLDGRAETKRSDPLEVHLDKYEEPLFADGWDELLANWYYGGAHPDLIAEADAAQRRPPMPAAPSLPPVVVAPPPVVAKAPPVQPGPVLPAAPPPVAASAPPPVVPPAAPKPVATPVPPPGATPAPPVAEAPASTKVQPPQPVPPPGIQQHYQQRRRVVQSTLPLAGDSIELQFFDNAEIDGDSISLFLNGRLLFEHVRLSAQPFTMRLAVADLPADAELTMVAENLGAIPPNTSFMMAYVNGQRYTARLESTENSSAVIVLRRPPAP
ncbi:MAG: hypothetical protein MUF62_11460 [Chitinophagaceae bacterium]|nr:hypothetical protein [Chitinophagaceae bacterium]